MDFETKEPAGNLPACPGDFTGYAAGNAREDSSPEDFAHSNPSVHSQPSAPSLAGLFKRLGEFLVTLDEEGIIRGLWSANRAELHDLETMLLGHSPREVMNAGTSEWIAEMTKRAIESDGIMESQYSVEIDDGKHTFSLAVIPVARKGRGTKAVRLVARDVTQQVRDLEKLKQSEALLAQAEQVANAGCWELDLETDSIRRSANLCRMLGVDPAAAVIPHDFFWQLVDPEDHEIVRSAIEGAMKNRLPYEYQARFILPDGSKRTLLARGKPIVDSSNRVIKRIGVALDITDRAEAARALQESEARYRDLVENSHDLVCTHDLDGRILSVNELPARILGYRPEDLIGRRIPDLLDPEVHGRFDGYIQRIQREGSAKGLMALRTRTGERRIWEYNNTLRTQGVPAPIVRGMARDITEQWEAEKRLRASQALLAHAEKIANFGSWEYDVAARRLLLSEHLRRMYSLAPDEEWTDEMQWERVHPGDREQVREIWNRATALGEPFSHVSRYLPPDGGVRVHFTRGVPVIGPQGKVVRWIGVIQDITGQARAEEELRRLTQELMRARDDDRRHMARELHASAGQSLAALKMSLGRLGSELPRGKDLAHELLNSAIELAEGAIREVRTVSYLMHPPMLDEAGLASALRWYADGFAKRSGIRVRVDVPEDFGRHSQEIETTVFRIVQEALTNVHRYSGSRTATIRLGSENGQIRAEVMDEGCGLPPANLVPSSRAPLGVGIASIRERVKQLNGVFEIESAPGQGTTMRVFLPSAAAEKPQGAAAVHELPPARAKLKTRARRRVKHASRR